MTYKKLYLYSAEEPTPRQFDVLSSVVKDYMEDKNFIIRFHDAGLQMPPEGAKILVFGSVGPDHGMHYSYQYTLSLKQLENKANAGTVMFAALDNYFDMEQGLPNKHYVHAWHAPDTLLQAFKRFDLSAPIAVDVETGGVLGENVTAWSAPMITIAFAQGNTALVSVLYDVDEFGNDATDYTLRNDILAMLGDLLPKIEKPIFHNGKFDIAVIESNTGVRMPNWFDTMLANHVLNMAAREHGLKILCKRYFNAAEWEVGIEAALKGGPKDYSRIPVWKLSQYNGYDVLWTYRLFQKLVAEIESDENAQTALYLEMQAAEFLYDVERNGIPFSQQNANALKLHYIMNAGATLDSLREQCGIDDFNPNSPQQVKRVFDDVFDVELNSTNKEALEMVIRDVKDDRAVTFAETLLEYRKATKMVSTYLIPWEKASKIEGDSRVHPTFLVHGTTTGRLASSDPNAQNVPRDKTIRKMVTLDGTNELL